MKIGYARVSTEDQNPDLQIQALKKAGCKTIYTDMDQTNGYEHQGRWLYPHYRAWVDDTGGKLLSSRRFTGLLRDLFENQLRLDGVEHRDGNKGPQFCGMRLRTDDDADQPCLITHHPPPVTDGIPPVTAETYVSDGCDTCDGFVQGVHAHPSPVCASGDPIQGAAIPVSERVNHSSHTSHPSLVRSAGVTAPVPPVTEALAEDTVAVGEEVELVATDREQQHGRLSQSPAMDRRPDTRCTVQDADTAMACRVHVRRWRAGTGVPAGAHTTR